LGVVEAGGAYFCLESGVVAGSVEGDAKVEGVTEFAEDGLGPRQPE